MPFSTSLLPSLLLAQALPTAFDANADFADGRLSLEVLTSEPVSLEDVRSKLTTDSLVVYVQGVVVERNRRAFSRPDGRTVNAYPRAEYTKFAVLFGPAETCSGSIDIEVKENRVRASVGCGARQASAAGQKARDQPGRGWRSPPARPPGPEAEIARPEPIAHRARFASGPSPPKSTTPGTTPGTALTDSSPAPAPPETTPPPPGPPAHETVPRPAPHPAPILAAAPAPVPVAAQPIRPAAAPQAPTGPDGWTGTGTVAAAVLLTALSIFLFWRSRRRPRHGLIRILESAPLGPKRCLVVAQIGGQKFILGASEAGITLLSSLGSVSETGTSQLGGENGTRSSETEPGPAAEGEKGLLRRLFSRREEPYYPEDDAPSTMAEDFRDLLEENIEDEELRRRLQSGAGGHTR